MASELAGSAANNKTKNNTLRIRHLGEGYTTFFPPVVWKSSQVPAEAQSNTYLIRMLRTYYQMSWSGNPFYCLERRHYSSQRLHAYYSRSQGYFLQSNSGTIYRTIYSDSDCFFTLATGCCHLPKLRSSPNVFIPTCHMRIIDRVIE